MCLFCGTQNTRSLFISTTKWAVLGAGAGLAVGLGTKAFLWVLKLVSLQTALLNSGLFRYYYLLPLALPVCVWLVRTFAPTAKGHGTEAVITAVHTRSGKIDLFVAPIKLLATVLTLAFGGSVGKKEGPALKLALPLPAHSLICCTFPIQTGDAPGNMRNWSWICRSFRDAGFRGALWD